MAIQGMVYKTRPVCEHLLVLLAPYEYGDEKRHVDQVGQRRLLIENYTFLPLPGDIIWGGSDAVILARGSNPKPIRSYRRKGYTRLIEDFGTPTDGSSPRQQPGA